MVDVILVPLCPMGSLTSVVAIIDWWRFCLAKGRLDPGEEIGGSRQLSRAWFNHRRVWHGEPKDFHL